MATRYSGDAKITMTYRDRGDYKVTVSMRGKNVWRGTLRPPACGYGPGIAYDSPAAYDRVAHAALSFANDVEGVEVGTSAVTRKKHFARRSITPFGARKTRSTPTRRR